jgi:aminoglycoside phosphotransferase family enzyme/predicted kinase
MTEVKHASGSGRPAEPEQAEIVTFLSQWAAAGQGRQFTTHGAHVFTAGGEALKIKRSVSYPYLDFSTLELRKRACERELEVNRANAPEIYLAVVPITREADGRLSIAGTGSAVEWAVHMRAFDQADLLGARAAQGELDAATARTLAEEVYASHARARVATGIDSGARLAGVVAQLVDGFAKHDQVFAAADREAFQHRADAALARARPCLARRAAAGRVRRVHGDLHLDNVVLWQGRPVLFDAIEFDEDLATTDILYDLAFLLMDLDHRGRHLTANRVLNRYLWRANSDLDLEGLAALPLLLGLRAGVRALVAADRLALAGNGADAAKRKEARAYLAAALGFLAPAGPRIVAVGGLSGTGKSTLGAALAAALGPAPGAVHLRSDLERKTMFGVAETVRLGPEAYTPETSIRVYDTLMRKAGIAAAAGHGVVVDAVFARANERAAIEAVAAGLNVPFQNVWLSAPRDVLLARVAARIGDASDATAAVVEQQLGWPMGEMAWATVDATGSSAETEAASRRALGL